LYRQGSTSQKVFFEHLNPQKLVAEMCSHQMEKGYVRETRPQFPPSLTGLVMTRGVEKVVFSLTAFLML